MGFFGGEIKSVDLLNELKKQFNAESIEDYICVKCSINRYMKINSGKINPQLKAFMYRLASDRSSLDEDRFKEELNSWKEKTGD